MSIIKHTEKHFTSSDLIRDIVIGMTDGLTVPFALAAGLSGAVKVNSLIVTAGLAEIAAGSIAMGLGGYLAAVSEAEHYQRELSREHREIKEVPEQEKQEVVQVFREYGLNDQEIEPIIERLTTRPNDWVKFMMRFELGIEQPDPKRASRSAITIGAAYVIGGLIPLIPYMAVSSVSGALIVSIVVTVVALFVFGFCKGIFTTDKPLVSACQTAGTGGIAALVAFLLAKAIS